MRALVYRGPQTLELEERDDAAPGDGEVLVNIAHCGICGSDMHAFLGHDERRPAPLILGHEAAGTTADGRRVVINPLVSCGACGACRAGRDNLCATRQIISMPPREGAFAEKVAMPDRNVLPVPDGLSLQKAALTEPLACGWHGAKLALRHGAVPLEAMDGAQRPVVFGGGAIGLGAALALVAHGAPGAIIVEPTKARWDHIEAAGPFEPVLPASEALSAATPHLVVDGYGGGATRAAASALVRPGGVLVHIGLADAAQGFDTRRATLQEIVFVGAYTYTAAEFAETLAAIADGTLGALEFVEERPLADGPAAFADILAGRAAAPKLMLAME